MNRCYSIQRVIMLLMGDSQRPKQLDRTPVQQELDQLERNAKLTAWQVMIAGIPDDFSYGVGAVTIIFVILLVQLKGKVPSDTQILWVAVAGAIIFIIAQVCTRRYIYPAIIQRQPALVQRLRELLFEEGMFRDFLESEEAVQRPAAPHHAEILHLFRLPFSGGGRLGRFYSLAYCKVLSQKDFANYKHGPKLVEFRAALRKAIIEELSLDRSSPKHE